MSKKINGGVVIYLSLIVMFVGLAILYFLNSSGTTIFQNFKTKSVRTQLINNISSGIAIATDAELPEFNENNKIVIQTIEDGTIEIMRRPQYSIRLWGQNEYVGIARSELMKTSSDFTISLWFYPQTGGSNYPLNGEGLFTFGYLTGEESDFGYNGSFVRNGNGSEVRLVFRMALIDNENNHDTIILSSDQILDNSWYFLTITHDQNILKMFINGEMVDSSPAVGVVDWLEATDHNIRDRLFIGKRSADHSSGLFEGSLRNFGKWNTALSINSIRSIYNQGLEFNPLTIAGDYSSVDNNIVYFKMNENNGNRVYDLSINNIQGFVNANDFGFGLAVWIVVPDSFKKYIKTEFNGYERIEPFR